MLRESPHSVKAPELTAMYLFADKSRAQSAWAAVYYSVLRRRGMTRAQALRCLGQRWLKIIWKMWQTGTAYDAALHMRNQLAHGSWVLQIQSKFLSTNCW